ncbi:hypothetical protein LTR56_009450 [Elasticomyces elasticus]|nr:hypothetical protein LTR56_009450 [Elasticomyces elasticus]KAK3645882.1 hypothetical protein LTR22_014548 [Elasticomyces elasticus]KAK4931031.1 hypothetical protein LTR49_002446 [Elasticomyces elasticus]KAK5765498.1 hypothetical protein LTS12_004249 [Elasticomyces elasticus]
MTTTAPPATHTQPSRKGKKAWRKNVDHTPITSGLDATREEIIKHGSVIAEQTNSSLFAEDLTGDAEISSKEKLHGGQRQLKADEILGIRSAVPGLERNKRKVDETVLAAGRRESKRYKKGEYVSHKALMRLKTIADGAAGTLTVEDSAAHDPWAQVEVVKDPRFTFLEAKKEVRQPKTLGHAPISLAANGKALPNVRKPEAGKSYNPLVDDWAALLEREGLAAVSNERTRLAAEQDAADKETRALAEAAKVEEQDRNDYGTDYDSAWESEWEGIASGAEDKGTVVHVKKMVARKTPAERNKIKARKIRERVEVMERKQKERDAQVKRIHAIAKEMSGRDKANNASRGQIATTVDDSSADDDEDGGVEGPMQRRRFGRLPIPEAPLEVVLPDELEDSLRRLKPEGSLIADRYRNMLVNGKVEVRSKNWQWKRSKKDRTEKWSYKDWQLK